MLCSSLHFSQKEHAVNQDVERMLKAQLSSTSSRASKSLEQLTVEVSKLPSYLPIGASRGAFAYSKAREAAKLAVVGMDTASFERDSLKEKNRELEKKARKQAKRIAYLERMLGSVPPPEDEKDRNDAAPRKNTGTLFSCMLQICIQSYNPPVSLQIHSGWNSKKSWWRRKPIRMCKL